MIDDNQLEAQVEAPCAKPLGRFSVLYYGVGHMLNDITSACWFTYLLLFLTDIGFTPRDAATVMLSGQVADGLTTIFVGELIDRFGHFKLWHAGGSILVAVSFSLVFGGCQTCSALVENSPGLRTIFYSAFAAIFNVGWAATQISHMSMVICITLNATSRVVLASCRNAFTMVANLSLYGIAFFVFNTNTMVTPTDVEKQYSWIAYLSIFVGCCFVLIFLLGTREPRLKRESKIKKIGRIGWKYWLSKVLYHQVALVYVLMRLVTNVSQALLAFYVINELHMGQSSKALVPAIIYISSFIVSVALQEFHWNGHRLKWFFTLGALLWTLSGIAFFFLPKWMHNVMYLLAVVIGIANALMTVTAISMESVLVGEDLNGCGFVYASLGFLDKIVCGVVLYLLEFNQGLPSGSNGVHASGRSSSLNGIHAVGNSLSVYSLHGTGISASLTRWGFGLVPGICSLLGIAVTFTMNLNTVVSKHLTEPLLE
ncbi:uncharacterized protein LOC116255753 [Nymphaea colorata]|nr:uncharacterized protein LOC116255753 [Nymphaea colorata]